MPRQAWLTPDLTLFSAPVQCRTIELPGDLWQYITGALLPLTYVTNWEQFGTATPTESAEYFQNVIGEYLISMCAHIGEIRPFTFTPLPDRWLLLDGTAVSVTDYPGLAAVVPSSWLSGGDINLPDMATRVLIGAAGTGYALGAVGGEEEHTLTVAEMPAHNHSYEIAVLTVDIAGELPAPALDALAPASTGSTGGGDAHNNMPPFLVINWGIYAGV
jgi:microcystin-dependent protein